MELQATAFCQLLSYNSWAKINQFSDLNHSSDICQEQRNEKERKSFKTLKMYHVLNEILLLCLIHSVTKETVNKKWEARSADSITILLEKPPPDFEISPIMVTTVSCSLCQSRHKDMSKLGLPWHFTVLYLEKFYLE